MQEVDSSLMGIRKRLLVGGFIFAMRRECDHFTQLSDAVCAILRVDSHSKLAIHCTIGQME